MPHPHTLGELLASPAGRVVRSVKDEMRANLIARLATGAPLFPGIVGYDETVVPQVVNAAGQHQVSLMKLSLFVHLLVLPKKTALITTL